MATSSNIYTLSNIIFAYKKSFITQFSLSLILRSVFYSSFRLLFAIEL